MATIEGLVLDGLDLNQTGATPTYTVEEFTCPPAPKKPEWAESSDRGGALLVRDPLVANREGTMKVRIYGATRDAAHTAHGTLVDKLEEAEQNPLGIPLVWTPADSTKAQTLYVLTGEIDDLPVTWESGYFSNNPLISVKFTCRPYGYGTEVTTVLDDFSTNSIASYTFDSGSGLAISGGQLVPSSTALQQLYRFAEQVNYTDAQVTMKVVTGASVAAGSVSLIGKRIDASNVLMGSLVAAGASSTLQVFKVDGGTPAALGSPTSGFTLSTGTSYWLRFRIEGNLATVELFTAAPTATSTPAQSVSYTLTGADATKFGTGNGGKAGIRTNSVPTDWRYDDLQIDPYRYKSSTPLIDATLYGVQGDVPAEARLITEDQAGQDRWFVAWGLEWRNRNGSDLLLTQNELTTTGFAGTATTRTGAYS